MRMNKISRGATNVAHEAHMDGTLDLEQPENKTIRSISINEWKSTGHLSSVHMKTWTAESINDEDDVSEKNSGYVLVDLKGDKMPHVDQIYLVGCEVSINCFVVCCQFRI